MAQIVEANARQRLMLREQQMSLMGDGSRLQGPSVGLRHDKGVIRQRNAEHLKLLGSLCSVAAPVWSSALPAAQWSAPHGNRGF
jgi:hypothetical protein